MYDMCMYTLIQCGRSPCAAICVRHYKAFIRARYEASSRHNQPGATRHDILKTHNILAIATRGCPLAARKMYKFGKVVRILLWGFWGRAPRIKHGVWGAAAPQRASGGREPSREGIGGPRGGRSPRGQSAQCLTLYLKGPWADICAHPMGLQCSGAFRSEPDPA